MVIDSMFDFPFSDELLRGLIIRLRSELTLENIQSIRTYMNDTLDIPYNTKHHIKIRLELLEDATILH